MYASTVGAYFSLGTGSMERIQEALTCCAGGAADLRRGCLDGRLPSGGGCAAGPAPQAERGFWADPAWCAGFFTKLKGGLFYRRWLEASADLLKQIFVLQGMGRG